MSILTERLQHILHYI